MQVIAAFRRRRRNRATARAVACDMKFAFLSFTLASALSLSACSQSREEATDAEIAAQESAAASTDDSAMTPSADASASTALAPAPSTNSKALALEGLGDLVIGKPVPAGSRFAERGAQIEGACRTVSSPDYPGVYAIVEGNGGPVRRITVSQRSDVKLVENVGVGSTEQEVLAAFPGFRSSPHKYVAAPGKYLTQPGDDPRLRFELGENGRVTSVHVGLMPQLSYVEGCA